VALSVIKANGGHPIITGKRPGKTNGGILATGKKDESVLTGHEGGICPLRLSVKWKSDFQLITQVSE
tara:strand:- start:290 stop:490 length:201 start_codon:yes stop_codon:yes gene_type:complete